MTSEISTWQGHEFWYVVEEGKWELKHAKSGDIGFDLPVVINAQKTEFKSRVNYDSDANYHGTLMEKIQWIYPNGSAEDPVPFLEIPPNGGWAEVSTGLRVKLPVNTWGNIKGRSSTSWKRRLTVIEGVIDEAYIGPLFALVQNNTSKPIRVHEGDRLAQLIIVPKAENIISKLTTNLPSTERGHTGFGSSGS